ncbi:MAG: GNAT family N-acetyltransferase [Dongiaceae bacterium]
MSGPAPVFRAAAEADLPALVAMLADDALGATREDPRLPLDQRYLDAFRLIAADPRQLLLVAESEGAVVGCLQLTFLPGLAMKGAWRGQIEAVRVAGGRRGTGIGRQMLAHAIGLCRQRGCRLVQLTADKRRPDAHRFYASLGFVASHEGFKLAL